MKIFIYLICLTSSLLGISKQEAVTAFSEGNKAFGEGRWEDAEKYYQQAALYGQSPQVFFNLGQTYMAQQKPGMALGYLLRTAQLAPNWKDLDKTLKKLYENNPTIPIYKSPWYKKAYSLYSHQTWLWIATLCGWLTCGSLIYWCFIQRKRRILLVFIITALTSLSGTILCLLNQKYRDVYVLTTDTLARFAPAEQSPTRHIWPMGSQGWVKSEKDGYFFLRTLSGEDGWIKQQEAMALR